MADILIGTEATDENGLAVFADLPDGTYKYLQKSAPNGYVQDPQEYTITIAGSAVTVSKTNEPEATGTLVVHKHVLGNLATPVAGATFALMKGDKVMLAESTATGAGGNVAFPNLMSIDSDPQDYTVQEVAVPTDYLPNKNLYTTAVVASGTSTQDVPNIRKGTRVLNINLKDDNYPMFGLQGSDYELYYSE